MRHEAPVAAPPAPLARMRALRDVCADASAEEVLAAVIAACPGEVALVSSFGAEAAVLLDMVSRIDRDLPVLFADTLMLFEETLEYQRGLADRLGLRNVQHVRPDTRDLAALDPRGDLHARDADACCVIRKVAPLDRAILRYPVTISGRKRFQAATRAGLEVLETDGARVKVSPLAAWTARDVAAYLEARALPRHPLVARGFASIGCAPCTTPTTPGEDARAGRWRGSPKVECGIHFAADGRPGRAS